MSFAHRHRSLLLVSAGIVVLLVLGAVRGPGVAPEAADWALPQPPVRPDCVSIAAGSDLQAAVDGTPAGSALCLEPGAYDGPVVIEHALTLWGPPSAIVRSRGEGTTIDVRGDDVALLGFTVSGSGGRFDVNDAAVRVSDAGGVRVEGLTVRDALFGILAEGAERVVVRGNTVIGDPMRRVGIGLRGDGIRFWSTTDSRIEQNLVQHSRDVVLWYSSRNAVVGNRIEYGRYGAHFMYSHDCVVERNQMVANVVGTFVMYTRGVRIVDNLFADHASAGGLGIGLKDSGDVTVSGNALLHNRVAIHIENSPSSLDEHNEFEGNVFALSETAVVFHESPHRTAFRGNEFRDNRLQVRVDGGGDATGIPWENNVFDDYAGYDLDGDGFGDLPYALRSFSGELTSRRPTLLFLQGAPALWLVDMASHVSPLMQPRTVLVDERPRVAREPSREVAHAN